MEVITYGGAEFVTDAFNAVAAIVGTGAYSSALKIAFLLGLLFAIINVVAQHNPMVLFRWFITSLLIYLCLLVPKTNVTVTDRLNPGAGGTIVANVPIGIATVASWTTVIGDEFTQLTESAFSLPADQTYNSNGYIFGSAVLRNAYQFRVVDKNFERNLSGFIRGCVFFDIHSSKLGIDDLKTSTNIWQTITTDPNPARSIQYRDTSTSTPEVKTCDEVANLLNTKWDATINQIATRAGKNIRPELTDAAARALVLDQLVSSHDFFLGVAQTGEDTIRQAALANVIQIAVRDEGAELGADALVEAYTQARTDDEAARNLEQGARIAARFVPLFRTVAEVVFYALFPVVFPIFLLPGGGFRFAKGYMTGFLSLMAWGPLYAILHRLMMGTGRTYSLGAGSTEGSTNAVFTIETQSALIQAHGDIALIAGYLTLLIPFAAVKLGSGAQAFAGLSQSFLSPIQGAAAAASREASTGNVSLGNTGFNTHRFDTVDGNKYSTSGFSDIGESTTNMGDGGRQRMVGGGAGMVYDGTSAIPRTASDIQFQSGIQSAFSKEASQSLQEREALTEAGMASQSALMHSISEAAYAMNSGMSLEEATGFSSDSNVGRSFLQTYNGASNFSENFHSQSEKRAAIEAYVAASAAAKGGISLFGNGVETKLEGGVKGSVSGTWIGSDMMQAAETAVQSDSLALNFSDSDSASSRANASTSSSQGRSFREAFASNFQELQSTSQSAEHLQARANAANTMASVTAREGNGFNVNMNAGFFDYVANSVDTNGHIRGNHGAYELLQSNDVNEGMERAALRDEFIQAHVQESLSPSMTDLVQQPSFEGFNAPSEFGDVVIPSSQAIGGIAETNDNQVRRSNAARRRGMAGNVFSIDKHSAVAATAESRRSGAARSIDQSGNNVIERVGAQEDRVQDLNRQIQKEIDKQANNDASDNNNQSTDNTRIPRINNGL